MFHYFLYQVGIIWVRTGLFVSFCVGAELCVNSVCVYFVKKQEPCFYIYLFIHEKMSICVYMRCSKVDDGADSLCAVYYHILCNYIITANHPPEVA